MQGKQQQRRGNQQFELPADDEDDEYEGQINQQDEDVDEDELVEDGNEMVHMDDTGEELDEDEDDYADDKDQDEDEEDLDDEDALKAANASAGQATLTTQQQQEQQHQPAFGARPPHPNSEVENVYDFHGKQNLNG